MNTVNQSSTGTQTEKNKADNESAADDIIANRNNSQKEESSPKSKFHDEEKNPEEEKAAICKDKVRFEIAAVKQIPAQKTKSARVPVVTESLLCNCKV